MNPDLIRALKADCQELTQRFYRDLDAHEYAQLSQLFAADGVWSRQGKQLKGPPEVLAELEKRPATLLTRHVIGNQIVDVLDPDHLRSQCYVTLYYADTGKPPQPPTPFTGPTCLFTYHDEWRLTAGAWKITRKWSTMDFSAL
jgi:SnoaL-like domain